MGETERRYSVNELINMGFVSNKHSQGGIIASSLSGAWTINELVMGNIKGAAISLGAGIILGSYSALSAYLEGKEIIKKENKK